MSLEFLCVVPTYTGYECAILTHAKYIDLDTLEYSVLDIRAVDISLFNFPNKVVKVLQSVIGKEVYLPSKDAIVDDKFSLWGIPIDGFGCAELSLRSYLVRESVMYYTNAVTGYDSSYKLLMFYNLVYKNIHFGVSLVRSKLYSPFVEFDLNLVPLPIHYDKYRLQYSAMTYGTVNMPVKSMDNLFILSLNSTGCVVSDRIQVLHKMPYKEYVVSPSIQTLVIATTVLSKIDTLVIPNTVEYLIYNKSYRNSTRPSINSLFIPYNKPYTKYFLSHILCYYYMFESDNLSVDLEDSIDKVVGLLSKYMKVEFI